MGRVPHTGEKRDADNVLDPKPEGRRRFGRPRRRWESNIKTYLKEKCVDYIVLDQNRDQWRAF
jgi:hypothetical protein